MEALPETSHHASDRNRLDVQVDLAGLDLRQVEDVVDEREQIIPGAGDALCILDLFRREVAFSVVTEELGEDKRAVERSPQLMRHVREELGLVATRSLKLCGLLPEHRLGRK